MLGRPGFPGRTGGAAGLIALTAFYRGLAIGTMSIVAPISATGVAVPVIVGIAGGDRPAALQIVGIVAAGAGVVLASREPGAARIAASRARASLGLALAPRHGLLSVVSVLASLYPLATVLLARAVLGERVRRVQEVGIVIALTGVLLIVAG